MTYKIRRNEPCPCGSGKKYKQCCGNHTNLVEVEKKSHDGAVERAVDWLMSRHRKAVNNTMEEMIFGGLSDDARAELQSINEEAWQGIYSNATEWLLAEGKIPVNGEDKSVQECLFGQGGPLFTVDQQRWLVQLATRPLRLYDVTEVIPGKQMTLCDALDFEAQPIIVSEKSGSQASLVGAKIGFRLMEVDDHYELSGSAYRFSHFSGPNVVTRLREAMVDPNYEPEKLQSYLSFIIWRNWLDQYCGPMAMPKIIDAYSSEAMLLITDHYSVKDWAILAESLATQHDVDGDLDSGWDRLIDCDDGNTRSTASINIDDGADKIEVFYKTQVYADEGRAWFEALVKDSVQFISREVIDPAGDRPQSDGEVAIQSSTQRAKKEVDESDLPPELLGDVIEEAIYRFYAKWADKPLGALEDKTPRQAIKTGTGLERVKGLLRGYQISERGQAEKQGRREISYAFLWDELGIGPQ